MQADAELHETARRIAGPVVGVADACSDQLAPFQRATSGCAEPPLGVWLPTAMHEVADVHETRLSIVRVEPAGVGTVAADQLVPFHVCATAAFGVS
jgi:hypothetical protein